MDVTRTETLDDVKSVIVGILGIEARADRIDGTTPLFGAMPELDSMAVVELVVALEQRFGVAISDDEITGEVFETVGAVAAFIDAKRG
jgi:acyl carrier protein